MRPTTIPLSMSQIHLIPCQEGYLQVDTSYEHAYPRYRRGLEIAGVSLDQIKYLFLTHHHDDHAGFLNNLTQDAGLTIIAHEQAQTLLQSGKNDKNRGGGYINRFIRFVADLKMRLNPQWTLTFPPFHLRQQDILIPADDDQVLRRIGVQGQILYTPGHCIDHIVIAMDNGEVFCGDAAASFLLWAGTKYCTVFMTDMEQAYHSWHKMLSAGAQTIYPAHGKPFHADKLRQNMGRLQTQDLIRFF